MKQRNSSELKIFFSQLGVLLFVWMLSVQAQTVSDANDYAQFINEQKSEEASVTAPYQNEVTQLASTTQKNSQTLDIQNYIRQLQIRSVLFNSTPTTQSASNTGQIFIFVSASMPQESLQQWFQQAQKIHAALVLQGFINNSLPDTKNWVRKLIEKNNNRGGIQINPIDFERYSIRQVPAVVATNGVTQSSGDFSDMTPSFDVVYGNVSLTEALRTIAVQGDAANGVAQNALNILRTTRG